MKTLKAKTEVKMKNQPLYKLCPYCGGKLIETFQPTPVYDESNHVRMCLECDIAWIWEKEL